MHLENTIEALYETFADYPFKSSMEGCPCCVSGSDKEKIHTASLRDLAAGDLSRYAHKAMTTWGDTDDFRHFLPRILELLAADQFDSAVLRKLDHGQWKTWPVNEQAAIGDFLVAWWETQFQNKTRFDQHALMDLYTVMGTIDALLGVSKISFEDNSIRSYSDSVQSYYVDLIGKRKEFKDLDEVSAEKLLHWMQSNAVVLEQAFFHFENLDADLAQDLSIALFIIEKNC